MAFIQSDQMSPIQGTIGNQQIIQDNTPDPARLVGDLVNVVDTAGTAYGEMKGRSLVNEEIENIERARAEAESGRFTVGDAVPESINMDQKQWDMLAAAVQSGQMTQDRARLIASSRLRSRIAQEPFFADRMRKAASGLLGFNIESEAAQQYFSSFPTRSQLEGNKRLTQQDKWMEQAEAISVANGVPVDKVYRQIAAAEYGKTIMDIAQQERDAGMISNQDVFSTYNREQSKIAFTGIVGAAQQIFQEEGAVKEEQMERIIADSMTQELAQLDALWQGDQTSTEFARAQDVIRDRYEGYRTFVNSVGFDTLQEVAINRNKNERTLFSDQTMSDVKIISEVGGQEAVKAYFDSMSPRYNETQRAQLFEQFPILKRLHSLQNITPDELSQRLNTTSRKILSDEPLNEQDREVAAVAASQIMDATDNEDVKTQVFRKLAKDGKKYAGISIVAKKAPSATSVENVADVKREYEEVIPNLVQTLSREVESLVGNANQFGTAVIEMTVDQSGNIQINSSRPMSLPQGKLNELRNMASQINQFNKAHDNGWSTAFGESKEQYGIKIQQWTEQGKRQAAAQASSQQQDQFVQAVVAGAENTARSRYEALQQANPDLYTKPYEVMAEEIRRRRLEQIERQRRGE